MQKKSRGRLIHVSEFINEKTGRLAVCDANGKIIKDARKVIYPGTNGDAWWDTTQLLAQVKTSIAIFDEAHPNCQALFIFDQSSAHASLAPDALRAFEMNKSNGGKQRKQKNTIIPLNNPDPRYRGKLQKMTLDNGVPKGLQQVLEERGFDIKGLRSKCKPVCPFESQNCCMARLLSQQDDFKNQPSMLETLITSLGHQCIFLPKFHCELNPIEMVSITLILSKAVLMYSIGVGVNTDTASISSALLMMPRPPHSHIWIHVLLRRFGNLSTDLGGLWMLTERV